VAISAFRPSGFGFSPIPITDVRAYAELMEWSISTAREFFTYVRALEVEFASWSERTGKRRGKIGSSSTTDSGKKTIGSG